MGSGQRFPATPFYRQLPIVRLRAIDRENVPVGSNSASTIGKTTDSILTIQAHLLFDISLPPNTAPGLIKSWSGRLATCLLSFYAA